jgi:hypothetical protein
MLSPFTDGAVQISFGFDSDGVGGVDSPARFERIGTFMGEGTNIGFQGSFGTDTADPPQAGFLGGWFLRSSSMGMPFGTFVIQYTSSIPVTAASGEIWDIDGQEVQGGTVTEQYRVEAFDSSNNSLGVLFSPIGVLPSNVAPLDGRRWVFSFSGLSADLDHIHITFVGTKTMGIGLAFNNFHPTTAVPEPSALAISAMLGLTSLTVRKRRASRYTARSLKLIDTARAGKSGNRKEWPGQAGSASN